ncbi:MAG: hypothetical protein BWZ03_00659 [bacterium ADurb.BinA186]|nr:MAG: hypothetical protein BWZ03_00659 [bacterium ADurb.BinA186]
MTHRNTRVVEMLAVKYVRFLHHLRRYSWVGLKIETTTIAMIIGVIKLNSKFITKSELSSKNNTNVQIINFDVVIYASCVKYVYAQSAGYC